MHHGSEVRLNGGISDEWSTPPPFVGSERLALLVELEAAFDAHACTVVTLEGPRGWGKTRIVHELYARLAARPGSEYWPPRLTEVPPDGSRTRHVIVPDAHPGDAQLPWLWWGVSCHLRPDGHPAQALAEALPQLRDSRTLAAKGRRCARHGTCVCGVARLGRPRDRRAIRGPRDNGG